MDSKIIHGPWAKRASADVLPLGDRRPSFAEIARMAGEYGDALDLGFGRAPKAKPTSDDLIKLSELLDVIALRARNYGYALSKPALLVVAQDAESLSERVIHLAAEIGDKHEI